MSVNDKVTLPDGRIGWVTKNGKFARRACTNCGGPVRRSGKGRVCRRCYRPKTFGLGPAPENKPSYG